MQVWQTPVIDISLNRAWVVPSMPSSSGCDCCWICACEKVAMLGVQWWGVAKASAAKISGALGKGHVGARLEVLWIRPLSSNVSTLQLPCMIAMARQSITPCHQVVVVPECESVSL